MLSADDVISLNDRRNSHAGIAVFHTPLNPYHFAESPDKYFRAMGDFGWERQGYVQLRASLHVLIQYKVQAASGNIARLPFLTVGHALGRYPNNYWERKIIASSGAAFGHYSHPPTLSAV
jgi:hypothetical protein